MIERRNILKGIAAGGLGVAAAASSFPRPALAQGRREWKMTMSWPVGTAALGQSAERLARQVELMTEGRFRISIYGAGELVPALQAFDAVQSGDAELYHSTEHYYVGKHPAFAFFSTVPFGLTAVEHYGWLLFGGGQALWDELSGGFGIKPFICGTTGPQMGGWFNKEINDVDDVVGLRIRQPGMGGEVWRRMGAAVVNIPPAELFSAMQTGTIDAVEWTGPWSDLQFGLHNVARYYYSPSIMEPSAPITIGINADAWNDLAEAEQLVLTAAIRSEALFNSAEWHSNNAEALDTLIKEHEVDIRTFPEAVTTEMARVVPEILQESGSSDELGQRIYESWFDYRRKQIAWSAISGDQFLKYRTQYFGA